jgi:molecular chaperone DnaK (HSP70)
VVEEAKIALSSQGAAVMRLKEPGIDLWELYTRFQFEQDTRSYRERVRQVVLDTLAESGLKVGQVQSVVTTGGSSNIPAFRTLLAEIFGAEKIKTSDAFSSVVAGLAIKASEN